MVSVCLPSDALLQHRPSYLGFSYLGRGVSLHGCPSKAEPLLLTLDEGYLYAAPIITMEYYSAIKNNTFESVLMRWIKLEFIIQSEVSQKEKYQYSILTHIYGI